MYWSIIRQELRFARADQNSISLWAQNYKELYGDGTLSSSMANTESQKAYGIISTRQVRLYSHPLLQKELLTLSMGTLVLIRRISVSGKWAQVIIQDRHRCRGWVDIDAVTSLHSREFKYLQKRPLERINFLMLTAA